MNNLFYLFTNALRVITFMNKDGEVLDIIEKFNSVSPVCWKIVLNEKPLSGEQSTFY